MVKKGPKFENICVIYLCFSKLCVSDRQKQCISPELVWDFKEMRMQRMHSDRISPTLVFFSVIFSLFMFFTFSIFSKWKVILLPKKETNMNVKKKPKIYMLRVHSVQTNNCLGYKTNKQSDKQKHSSLAAQFRSVTTYEEEEEEEEKVGEGL